MSVKATTRPLELPDARIVYDVRGPIPTTDGRPVLLMIGQPMEASGFTALASYFGDRTVVTYDPRGLGRSTRSDGRRDNVPATHAADLHALVAELDAGPVEIFGSSGGAVDGLALVQAHPEDVVTLVAHEPPLTHLLPDAALVRQAEEANEQAYRESGFGAGMARFVAFTSWEGPITEEFLAAPSPDPAMFGLSSEDDGSRDDPLLSGDSADVVAFTLNRETLRATETRIVVAAGEESARQVTGRCAAAVAARLGEPLAIFPSHHGGFLDEASGWGGQPEAFAAKLREVLTV